jgi:hypothetical protein
MTIDALMRSCGRIEQRQRTGRRLLKIGRQPSVFEPEPSEIRSVSFTDGRNHPELPLRMVGSRSGSFEVPKSFWAFLGCSGHTNHVPMCIWNPYIYFIMCTTLS